MKKTAGNLASCSPNSQEEQKSASPRGTSPGMYREKLTVYAENICSTETAS